MTFSLPRVLAVECWAAFVHCFIVHCSIVHWNAVRYVFDVDLSLRGSRVMPHNSAPVKECFKRSNNSLTKTSPWYILKARC